MKNQCAQSTIEFTFAMVVVALLIYGLIKTFQWVGMDYAQKAYVQQTTPITYTQGATVIFNSSSPRTERLNAFTRRF